MGKHYGQRPARKSGKSPVEAENHFRGEFGAIRPQRQNAVETGRYEPSLGLAFKIGRRFKRSVEEIFGLDGD
jgi:hypothetical protein